VATSGQAKRREAAKRVGDGIVARNSEWSFGGRVAETFTEHVRRSVPLYDESHDLICRISDYFVQQNSTVYDLGVSAGRLTAKLAARHENKRGVSFVGIDLEEGMVQEARKLIGDRSNVKIEVGDINLWDYEPCDLIVACYTIQFVMPRLRQALIDKLYRSLNWGGAFMLFE
jgi:tRNA (cmo5U34)-methyltransferase